MVLPLRLNCVRAACDLAVILAANAEICLTTDWDRFRCLGATS
jgi:hypothetical protein